MDSKETKPWNEEDEVTTVELNRASGGAAGTKSIPTQGGGSESSSEDGTPPSSTPQQTS